MPEQPPSQSDSGPEKPASSSQQQPGNAPAPKGDVMIVAPGAVVRIEHEGGRDKGGDSGEKKEGGDQGGKDGKKDGDQKPKKKFHWTPLKVIALIVVVLVILIVAIIYITYALTHETTDDAYTTGYVHLISARITSNVTELDIVDNEEVHQGQVLLRLDPRDFVVQVDRAQANYDKAKADFDRVDALKGDVAISKQDYDQTKTNLEVAAAELEDAHNQLSYCTVVAPTDGYIGNRTVNVGNRVTVGGSLMAVIQGVWVVANYKETQLGKMKENQPVQITVDAIPGVKFQGHIDSFSPGTGSTFALLPPDNATGNFTKIVQRVPIKILFEPDSIRDFHNRLLPGLSVETAVALKAPLVQVNDNEPKLSR